LTFSCVFDPTPDFVALIHGLRANPLPGIAARRGSAMVIRVAATNV
jgi:hypothetical protein